MQFVNKNIEGDFTTLSYKLTWPVSWEQMISFVNVIIKKDFKKPENLENVSIGEIAGAPSIDKTEEVKNANCEIRDCNFSKDENGYIIISGYSSTIKLNIRYTFYNQTNTCIIQLYKDSRIPELGERVYDNYLDSIEIYAHIDNTLNNKKD